MLLYIINCKVIYIFERKSKLNVKNNIPKQCNKYLDIMKNKTFSKNLD